VFQHGHSDSVFIICSCGDKEAMQKFIDDSFDIRADLELVG